MQCTVEQTMKLESWIILAPEGEDWLRTKICLVRNVWGHANVKYEIFHGRENLVQRNENDKTGWKHVECDFEEDWKDSGEPIALGKK